MSLKTSGSKHIFVYTVMGSAWRVKVYLIWELDDTFKGALRVVRF